MDPTRTRTGRLAAGLAALAAFGAAPAAHAAPPLELTNPTVVESGCSSFVVPAGVAEITIVARGGAGGGATGGSGAQLTRQLAVEQGRELSACIGGGGAGGGAGEAGGDAAQVIDVTNEDILMTAGGGGGRGGAHLIEPGTPGGDAGAPGGVAGDGGLFVFPAAGGGSAGVPGAGGGGDAAGSAGAYWWGGTGAFLEADGQVEPNGGGGGGGGTDGGGGGGAAGGLPGGGGGGGGSSCSAPCTFELHSGTARVTISWEAGVETATALAQTPAVAVAGDDATLTATVTPNPGGGTVAFTGGGDPIHGCGAVAVDAASGIATCTLTTPWARWSGYSVAARFGGAPGFRPSGGTTGDDPLTANARDLAITHPSTLTLGVSSPTARGAHDVYTAELAEHPFGGTVSFTIDGRPIAGCTDLDVSPPPLHSGRGASGPVVSCHATAPADRGSYEIAASYSGSSRDLPAQDSAPLLVYGPALTADGAAFGAQPLGEAVERTVTVTNAGEHWARVSTQGVALRGDAAGDYALVADDCAERFLGVEPRIPAGDPECTVTVRFTPTAAGARDAQLVVPTDDDGEFVLPLTGTGVAPAAPAPGAPAPEAPAAEQPRPKPVTGAILDPSVARRSTQGTITRQSRLTLPLRCPTWLPCTVTGRVITDAGKVGKKGDKSKQGKRRVRHLIQYRGVAIGADETVKVSGRVGRQARKLAARNKRRVIPATLVIDTVLQDGSRFTSRQQIKLRVAR